MLTLRKQIDRPAIATEDAPGADGPPAQPDDGPQLALLVNDAVSLSVRWLHTFADSRAAEEYVDFWFHRRVRHGLIAFWALPEKPEAAAGPAGCELAVLIGDDRDPDLVRAFSFPDYWQARAFLRSELAQGLDPAKVRLYWAVPVAITTGASGEAQVSPARPPVRRRRPAAGQVTDRDVSLAPDPESLPEPLPVRPVRTKGRLARLSSYELIVMVRSVLRTRRWDEPRVAFQGFGSPPGRF